MSFENKRSSPADEFHGPNLGYILELYEQYRKDPQAVDESTRKLFARWSPEEPTTAPTTTGDLVALSGAANLGQAIRVYGYLSARLDPLAEGTEQASNPILTPEFHQIKEEDLSKLPADVVKLPEPLTGSLRNAGEVIDLLRSIYCGTISYDYGHIRIPEEREWLFQAAETGRFRAPGQPLDGKK